MDDVRDPMRPQPLSISRLIKAPRETVFRAWSFGASIKRWFCPEDCSLSLAEVDFRAGGAFNVLMHLPDGKAHRVDSIYTELVAPERLAFTSQVSENGKPLFNCTTTVTFTAEAGGTRLDVVQAYEILDPFWAKAAEGAKIGWSSTLDRLEAQVALLAAPAVHGSFTLERVFAAPPARVFHALTDMEAKAKWFSGGDQYKVLERTMDARPGGRETLEGLWTSGTVSRFDAVYFDVVAGRRLVYAYEMHIDGVRISVSLATLELSPAGDGTRLVLTEQGSFLDGYEDNESREHGTGILLDQLGTALGGLQVEGVNCH